MILHFDLVAANFLNLEREDLYPWSALRVHLEQLGQEPKWSGGLLAWLLRAGRVDPQTLVRVSHWTTRYLGRCRQAIVLRILERHGMHEDAIHALIAVFDDAPTRLDTDYLLRERTLLPGSRIEAICRQADAYLRDWSTRTVALAKEQGYVVTLHPMVTGSPLTEGCLRLSALFRSPRTSLLLLRGQREKAERKHEQDVWFDLQLGPSPYDLQVGDWVGPYAVLSKLGEGGMGRIYLAQASSGECVALKTVRTEVAEPEDLARFDREAVVLRSIRHPAVLPLLDEGVTPSGLRYLVLPAISGETLQECVTREGCLPVRTALGVADSLLETLEAIHTAGVIHKDLKPENLMLNDRPQGRRLYVIDFGLSQLNWQRDPHDARAVGAQALFKTRASEVVGTAAYLSPEQIQGGLATRRSDLYSLGVILFFLLTGRTPFSGATHFELLRAHVEDAPQRLAEARPGRSWDPRLQALLDRLLEKNPPNRLPGARQVRRAVRQLLEDLSYRPTPSLASSSLGNHVGPGGGSRLSSGL